MTDRKPDFYVVRRVRGKDAQWLCGETYWSAFVWRRHRFATRSEAQSYVTKAGGTVHPVFCTSKRAEPKMRERSSAWVLKRLAEGKVLYRPRHEAGSIMFSETLIRWERVDGIIEFCVPGEMVWSSKRGQLCFDGKMLCRVARPSEVPQ